VSEATAVINKSTFAQRGGSFEMNAQPGSLTRTQTGVIATNRVLRNTYALLALTLLFSAFTAGVSMALELPHPGLLLTLAGYFGLLYLTTTRYRNSGIGLAMVFALTGFMGYTLGRLVKKLMRTEISTY
jgi:modulator of FtsH protease